MTQAFNLSQFANKLNSSGQTDNTGLQNSAVTVTAGTGMSGGGSVSLGGSTTLTNAGVTSIVAGTGISVSGATGAVTVSASGGSGVTSAVAGNGISVSGSTGAVTFSAACPTFNTIGSYTWGEFINTGTATSGSNYSAGAGAGQFRNAFYDEGTCYGWGGTNNLSGTWKWMSGNVSTHGAPVVGQICRVA
jgi:hypothetical protein